MTTLWRTAENCIPQSRTASPSFTPLPSSSIGHASCSFLPRSTPPYDRVSEQEMFGRLCLILSMAATPAAAQVVHHVPAGGNLQAAINAAQPGDIITLA